MARRNGKGEERMPNGSSDLLNAFRHGSPEAFEAAFETLFHQHQRAVYGWILRIVRNTAAAEDLTVETFWRIHRAHDRFQPECPFGPWARRIATRTALDWLRAQRPEVELTAQIADALPSAPVGNPGIAAEIRSKTALAFGRFLEAQAGHQRRCAVPGRRLRAVLGARGCIQERIWTHRGRAQHVLAAG